MSKVNAPVSKVREAHHVPANGEATAPFVATCSFLPITEVSGFHEYNHPIFLEIVCVRVLKAGFGFDEPRLRLWTKSRRVRAHTV